MTSLTHHRKTLIAFKQNINDFRMFLVATCFTIYMITSESVLFNINYIDSFKKTLIQHTEYTSTGRAFSLILTISCSILLIFLFIWSSLKSKNLIRFIAFILFSTGVMYEYAYFNALQRFTTPEDIIMATYFFDTNLYYDTFLSYFQIISLIPVIMFGGLLIVFQPQERTKPRSFIAIIIIMILFNTQVYHHWYLKNQVYPTIALDNFYRTITFTSLRLSNSFNTTREPLLYTSAQPPKNNIVLVIDESIRADHLSLNGYTRPTTPFLEELSAKGVLYNWGEAASGSTATWYSNPLILTGLTTLPDKEGLIRHIPVIYQYAKAMGYTTHYLDASSSVFWNGELNDLQYIDHWENQQKLADGSTYDADTLAAKRIRQIVNETTGNFIVLNKRGVHAYYNRAFPATAAVWNPVMATPEYDPLFYKEIINSYDNGVHYNLETFFRALIDNGSILEHTSILYTSDHGQTLAEDGATWSHNSSTRNEARVPLFLITGKSYNVDLGYRASHSNIVPTLLDLLEYPESERKYRYELSLLRARASNSRQRRYTHGPLDGSGGGSIKDFDLPTEITR